VPSDSAVSSFFLPRLCITNQAQSVQANSIAHVAAGAGLPQTYRPVLDLAFGVIGEPVARINAPIGATSSVSDDTDEESWSGTINDACMMAAMSLSSSLDCTIV
jgi:hypothetical protein